MAGIGFLLRKLASEDNYSGVLKAFFHSALIAAGPWVMTVIAIACIYVFTENTVDTEQAISFRSILVYNFSLSLVFSSPIFIISTRYLADHIYLKDISNVGGLFILSLALQIAIFLPIAIILFYVIATLDAFTAFCSVANCIVLNIIWTALIFVGALKNYTGITFSFVIGIFVATLASIILGIEFQSPGMLVGFTLGLTITGFALIGLIFVDYPTSFKWPKGYFTLAWKMKKIAIALLCFNAALWVDKWIMWTSPEAERHINGLKTYSFYDTAMFISFLSIIPMLSLAVFSVETHFFEDYLLYYKHLQNNFPYRFIEYDRKSLINQFLDNTRNMFILQASVTVLLVLLAPDLFNLLKINFLLLGMFRLGTLAALFTIVTLLNLMIFAYFDSRRNYFIISVVFFMCNTILSFISKSMGFVFYGYGFFLASLIAFLVSSFQLASFFKHLNYHVFITNNLCRTPIKKPIKKHPSLSS